MLTHDQPYVTNNKYQKKKLKYVRNTWDEQRLTIDDDDD